MPLPVHISTLTATVIMYQQPARKDVVPYQPRDYEQDGHWSYRVLQGLTLLAAFCLSYLLLKFLVRIPHWIGPFLEHLKDRLGLNRTEVTDEEQQPLLPAPEEQPSESKVRWPLSITWPFAARPSPAKTSNYKCSGCEVWFEAQSRQPPPKLCDRCEVLQEEPARQVPPEEPTTTTSRPSSRSSSLSRPSRSRQPSPIPEAANEDDETEEAPSVPTA
ncbi:hypothetical protein PG984_014203 [Apiospora sp. TS-2023a]